MDVHEDQHEVHEFGWWPEVLGAIAVCILIWSLVAFARGTV